ncbi:MAG: ABC transporter ATP-binding protein [Dongiaceae bacterium]
MSWLDVEHLSKSFGEDTLALDDVSFALEKGEFFCIVGPTNAGKSTLLKTIAGLYRPDRGRIHVQGRDVTMLQPKDRQLSLLFQNIALFPTLTGFENIAFPLRTVGMPAADVTRRVAEVAEMLKVPHLLDRLPRTFSGGEQQRVAIGRAIALSSRVLMLDEPLTNLDARIRIALRIEFKALHRDTGQTMLYVTHDQVEAMSLSDRIVVLNQGRLQQIGTPDEVYHRPANRFVAQFVGTPPMNIVPAELTEREGRPILTGAGFEADIEGNYIRN